MNPIHKLEKAINEALEPMRPKLDKLTKLESKLKMIDPDVDIPDASDLEEEMETAEGKVVAKFDEIKDAIDIMGMIPAPFQTKKNFDKYIVYPVLVVYLSIVMFLAFQSTKASNDGDVVQNVNRYLRGSAAETIPILEDIVPVISDSGAIPSPPQDLIPDEDEIKAKIRSVVLSCFYANLAILLTFFIATLKVVIQSLIQCKIDSMKVELNEKIEEKVQPLKDKVTGTTTTIKEKFFALEEKIEKAEKILPFGL